MPVSLAFATVLGWLLTVAPSNERGFAPCAPDTSEWGRAGEGLAALDAQIEALTEDGDVRDAQAAMRALLDSRCFALAREESRRPTDAGVSALALKVWWRDGGKTWLASYLELGRRGPQGVVLPPDVRAVLTPSSAPDHRLAALLCPAKDVACGSETEAWRARAERFFRPEHGRHREFSGAVTTRRPDCTVLAEAKPKRWRYTAWRSCLGDSGSRPRQVALPLGRFRAPEDGWLVMRGRRGHYGCCDEVRAYHLRTGTAYVAKSCGGLVLMEGGEVDAVRTNAARQVAVSVGRMAPARLRELTWMLLLGPEVQRDVQVEAWRVPVPEGYRVERRELIVEDGVVEGFAGGATGWVHSGQTRLRWSWFPPNGAEPLSGELTYPDSSWVEVEHANVLLREAEATIEEGCPSEFAPLPMIDFTREPGVNGRDAPGGVTKVQDSLVEGLRAWRAPGRCGPSPDAD